MGEKRYLIAPRWFDGEVFIAETAGKAKVAAFKACSEALGRNITFRDYLDGLSVLHLGPAPETAGDAMRKAAPVKERLLMCLW